MISHISIKDFAIIENLDLDLNEGLNIITGETGAGKSIIIEAVSLALGARADTSYIRTGRDKALIQLVAEYDGEENVITREISSNGRNICRINGEICTLSQVQKLCSRIADIHGQYDHQSLLDPENHVTLVDLYGKDDIYPAKEAVGDAYTRYRAVSSELAALVSDFRNLQRQKDFMQFELNEIEAANLVPGEDDELKERISLLQNSEKIYSALESAYSLLYGSEDNISSALSRSISQIQSVSDYSKDIKEAEEGLTDISYSLEDITERLRDVKEKAVFDPAELDSAIERMDIIDNLKRKYAPDIEGVLSYMENLAEKLSKVENIDEEKERLTALKAGLENELASKCGRLTELRKKAALELQEKILFELKDLNFKDADLLIDISKAEQYTPEGNDIVEFMITTNKGEALKPLAKVASGGEMSRIMLAFKKITGDYDRIPCMVFDEIDTGISGITASIVSKKLVQISSSHQIICITHLPQIAAAGKYNYLIKKDVHDDSTFTDVVPLDHNGKVMEIARLLGGTNITETTLKSAEELINAAT